MNANELREKFLLYFGKSGSPIVCVKAPGRINLIGEHTDYNDGFVFPVAIDRFIFMAGRRRNDEKIIIYAKDKNEKVELNLKEISPLEKWTDYLLGVYCLLLKERNYNLRGVEIFFTGDLPIGKGLSSSAALEVATSYLLSALFDIDFDPVTMAKLCQKAENEFVGMPCGIMDQFISVLGKKDCALFLDCKDLSYSYVPLKSTNISIMIADSGVKRELASSPYKTRRNECEVALKLLKKILPHINSLRDLSFEELNKYEDLLPELLKKRVRHVVTENERVKKSVQYLKCGNLKEFGNVMYESHYSLRNDYEVSCRELDILVDLVSPYSGVIGSRMTGAGFGGSTVSLIEKKSSEKIRQSLQEEYYKKTGRRTDIYICNVVDGVGKM